MEKRKFLYKVAGIIFLIYLIVSIATFFKCLKKATAENYLSKPSFAPVVNSNRKEIFLLPELLPAPLQKTPHLPGIRRRDSRGYREM